MFHRARLHRLQVNGFAGVDYNSHGATHEEIARSIDAVFSTGVTSSFPTVITGSPDKHARGVEEPGGGRETLENGHAMEAFHVEGPHISPDDGPRGAHPRRWVRRRISKNFTACRTPRKEISGWSRWLRNGRVRANISTAHLGSRGRQHRPHRRDARADSRCSGCRRDPFDAPGQCRHATLPKFPIIWDQLAEDRLAASFIADGIHLDRDYFRAALRSKETSGRF